MDISIVEKGLSALKKGANMPAVVIQTKGGIFPPEQNIRRIELPVLFQIADRFVTRLVNYGKR